MNAHCCLQPPFSICCVLLLLLHTHMYSYAVSSGLSSICLWIAQFGRIIVLRCELRVQIQTDVHVYIAGLGLSFICSGIAEIDFSRGALYISYAVSSGLSFTHIYIYML